MAESIGFSDIPEDIKRLIIPISPYGLALACRQNWSIWKDLCFSANISNINSDINRGKIPYILDTAGFDDLGKGVYGAKYIKLEKYKHILYIYMEDMVLLILLGEGEYFDHVLALKNIFPEATIIPESVLTECGVKKKDALIVFGDEKIANALEWIKNINKCKILTRVKDGNIEAYEKYYTTGINCAFLRSLCLMRVSLITLHHNYSDYDQYSMINMIKTLKGSEGFILKRIEFLSKSYQASVDYEL